MSENTPTDDRSDNLKVRMATAFREYEEEYRTEPMHREVVYEDDDCVILADHTGNELNEWAALFDDVTREDLRSTFRALADEKMTEQTAHAVFSHSDPVVFDKFEEDDA